MFYAQYMTSLTWFLTLFVFVFGINVGSFLNVVIWRLPRGGSLVKPTFSYCPNCENRLQPQDLVPLFSFLFLGRKCRRCKKPISWRYFSVELLTGILFAVLFIHFYQNVPDTVSFLLFAAILVPITFIDLELFIIPDSLNLIAFGIAISRDIWGIAHHESGHELLWGWLPRSILGAIAGILIFGTVRVVGWIWKRVEAMGLGDVFLARAMGAMLISVTPSQFTPLRLFPIWVLLSCLSGLIVGLPMILLRNSQEAAELNSVEEVEDRDDSEEESSLGQQLLEIGWCLWLADLVEAIREMIPAWRRLPEEKMPNIEEDDWKPGATAIPFGPFMVVGFLAVIFIGEHITSWYLTLLVPKH